MKNLYKVLRPIGFNGRQEKNTIVSMTEDEAAAFGSQYVVLDKPAEPKVAEVPLDNRPLETLKVAELKELALKLGLDAEGTKAELFDRITLSRK